MKPPSVLLLVANIYMAAAQLGDQATLPPCEFGPVLSAATGENSKTCERETAYDTASLVLPMGDVLRSVCSNAACSRYFAEIRAARPTDCQFLETPIRPFFVEQFPAACAAAAANPEPTPTPTQSPAPTPTPTPDQTTPGPDPIPQCDASKIIPVLVGRNALSCSQATAYTPVSLALPQGDTLKAVCQNPTCLAYQADAPRSSRRSAASSVCQPALSLWASCLRHVLP